MDNKTNLNEEFKKHLALIASEVLGADVSKNDAWELFKMFQIGTVQFVQKKDQPLSMYGIGKCEIIKAVPRGKKAGLDKDGNKVGEAWAYVPKYRFRPSSMLNSYLASECGFEEYNHKVKPMGIFKEEK